MQKIYRETTQTRYSIGTSATSQRCQNKQANMLFDQQTYIWCDCQDILFLWSSQSTLITPLLTNNVKGTKISLCFACRLYLCLNMGACDFIKVQQNPGWACLSMDFSSTMSPKSILSQIGLNPDLPETRGAMHNSSHLQTVKNALNHRCHTCSFGIIYLIYTPPTFLPH